MTKTVRQLGFQCWQLIPSHATPSPCAAGILQKHPEYWTDPAFYENNLEEMFNVYDTNGDGKLDKTELAQIAAHGVKRFLDHYKKALLIDRLRRNFTTF